MLLKNDIVKFLNYVESTFEKDEIENALDAFEFERKYLKEEELNKLPPNLSHCPYPTIDTRYFNY